MKKDNLSEIKKFLEDRASDNTLHEKPFAMGMYRFSMFMISYYARVRDQLNLNYDSFMIIQTVVSHTLYHLSKNKNSPTSYLELETEWNKAINSGDRIVEIFESFKGINSSTKLTYSSICLVTKLPKETVRRKVNELARKNLLNISKKNGILLGSMYKKVFREFTPQTTKDVLRLIKNWEETGILKSILNFKL